MEKIIFKSGILGGLAVIAGAFGAHYLKGILDPEQLQSFNTGARYQLVHSIVLLFLFLIDRISQNKVKWWYYSSLCIFYGTILFSGSIYLLVLKNVISADFLEFLGPVTPLGGTLIILGWLFLVLGGIQFAKELKT